MPRKKGSVLLSDVAQEARVSTATASAVLNGRLGTNIRVSEKTQQRVLEAAKVLNYAPNIAARSLSGGRSKIIAIFTYEPIFPYEQRNFYFPFLVGIESEAERLGLDLLLITGARTEDGKRQIYSNGMNRMKFADGAIVIGLQRNEEELSKLIKTDFPVLFVGHRELPGVETSYVAADYTAATIRIVEYLRENGHRRIGYLGIRGGGEPGRERRDGYERAMRGFGPAPGSSRKIVEAAEDIDTGLLSEFLESGVTALISEDYKVCGLVLKAAEKLGLKIPEDLSMAVLAGPVEAGIEAYDWTSFRIPDIEMGKTAVSFLYRMIHSETRETLRALLPCELHYGRTVKNLASG